MRGRHGPSAAGARQGPAACAGGGRKEALQAPRAVRIRGGPGGVGTVNGRGGGDEEPSGTPAGGVGQGGAASPWSGLRPRAWRALGAPVSPGGPGLPAGRGRCRGWPAVQARGSAGPGGPCRQLGETRRLSECCSTLRVEALAVSRRVLEGAGGRMNDKAALLVQ